MPKKGMRNQRGAFSEFPPSERKLAKNPPLTTPTMAHQRTAKIRRPPDLPLAGIFHTVVPGEGDSRVIFVPGGGRSALPGMSSPARGIHSWIEALVPQAAQEMISSVLAGIRCALV